MSYSDDTIKQMFTEVDADGDGFITKEELSSALAKKNIIHTSEQLTKFFASADTNKDNKISLAEFTHYVHFKSSDIKEIDELLHFTASSVAALKKIDSINFLNAGDEHFFDIKLHETKVIHDNALQTRVKLLLSTGAENKNDDLLSLINFKLDRKFFLSFKFHVADKALVMSKLPIIYADAKIFLSELGPESAEFLQKTDVEFFEAPDGVIMAFRPRADCFISHYIKMIEASSANLTQINTSLGLTVGSDLDLSHYKTQTYENSLLHNLFVDFFGRMINLANIINLPEVQANFKNSQLPRDYPPIASFLGLFSMKNAKIELQMDKELKKQLIQASGLQKLNEKGPLQVVESLKKIWSEHPMKDLVDSMEFLKQLVNILHEAKNESVSVIVQCNGVIAAANLKANAYEFIQEFISLK